MPLKFTFFLIVCFKVLILFGQMNTARTVIQLGKQKNMLSGDMVGGSVFSPDSKFIITYGQDGSYIIWDIKTGREIQRLYTGTQPMTSNNSEYSGVAYYSRPSISIDDKYCITEGIIQGTYLLWDIATGQRIKEFGSADNIKPNRCIQAVFSPEGKYVMTNAIRGNYKGDYIFSIGLYDIKNNKYNDNILSYKGKPREDGKGDYNASFGSVFKQPYFLPSCIAISRDLNKIAIGLLDGRVLAFDFLSLKKKAGDEAASMNDMQIISPDEVAYITKVVFGDDNRTLIIKNKMVLISWDVVKRKELRTITIPTYKELTLELGNEPKKIVDNKFSVISDDGKTLGIWEQENVEVSGKMNFYDVLKDTFLYSIQGAYYDGNRQVGDMLGSGARYGGTIKGISNDTKYFFEDYFDIIGGKDGTIKQVLNTSAITLTNSGFLDNGNKIYIGKPLNDAFIFDFKTGECKRLRNFFYNSDTSLKGSLNYTELRPYENSNNIRFSKDESIAVSYDIAESNVDQYVYIWNTNEKKVIKKIELTNLTGYPPFNKTEISNDNKNILFTEYGMLYNFSKDKIQALPINCHPVFSDDNKSLIYGEAKSDKTAMHIYLKIMDLLTLRVTKTVELKYKGIIKDDTDSLSKALGSHQSPNYFFIPIIHGQKMYGYQGHNILSFDISTGNRVMSFDDSQASQSFGGRKGLDENTWKISEDGSLLASAGDGNNNQIYIYDLNHNGKIIQTLSGYKNMIISLSFSPDKKRLISTSADRTAVIWDLESGKELALFVAYSDNDYALTTPEGYYMATKGGVQALHFVKGITPYLFDQFDLQYNRPDKVLEKIGIASPQTVQGYRKAYQKRLEKMGFDSANFEKEVSFNVPELEVINKLDEVEQVKSNSYKISIDSKDKLYNLDRLNVLINGVQVFGSKGFDLKKYNSKNKKTDLSVTLSRGLNIIAVSVLNQKGIESLTERFEVNYAAPFVKPNLYVVTIGDSKYSNPSLNLTYAAKDAEDVSTLFQGNNDYNKIIPILLTNEKVTKENVLKVKDELLKSNVDDKIIIFYAGHGIFSSSLDYYLGTTNMDFMNPQNGGLLYEDLESLIDSIPARNKILLVDACHSGEIDKEEIAFSTAKNTTNGQVKFRAVGDKTVEQKYTGLDNSFEMMKQLFTDLRKSTGATVISSAGGGEFAMEGDKWKNGVFTYCLLRGIKEKKADLNEDGKIMVSELQEYVQKQVQDLTNGKQTPTSRTENLVNDFQIW